MYKKLKGYLKRFRQIKRNKELKKTLEGVDFDLLVNDIRNIGVKQGDILWIHSSLKSIGYVKGGPQTVIDAFLEVIGREGTLIIPTFSGSLMINICKDKNFVYDLKKTMTGLGAIPSTSLKMKNIYRSIHPTHSVVAIGKYAEEITKYHHIGNKTFGQNTPFGKIIELNGDILGIGITFKHAPTQYHYIEDISEKFEFPFRVNTIESYFVKCKLYDETLIEIEVHPSDPEISKTRIDKKESIFIQNYLWEIYERMNKFKIGYIGNARSWLIKVKSFSNLLINLAKIGITIYSTKEELIKNKLYPFNLIKEKLIKLKNIL